MIFQENHYVNNIIKTKSEPNTTLIRR